MFFKTESREVTTAEMFSPGGQQQDVEAPRRIFDAGSSFSDKNIRHGFIKKASNTDFYIIYSMPFMLPRRIR